MYQPRRAAAPGEPDAVLEGAPGQGEGFTRPRRVASSWHTGLARRAGIGALAVAAASAGGVAVLGQEQPAVAASASPATSPADRSIATSSRSLERTVQVRELATSRLSEVADDLTSLTPLYSTATLSVRKKAAADSRLVTSLYSGTKVLATSQLDGKFRKVQTAEGAGGWVLAKDLSDAEPEGGVAGELSMAPCPVSSSIEAKIRPDTILIYRSVCANFPGVNSYGGWRPGGLPFHRNGRAVDMMLTPHVESAMGWRIARFITSHYRELNIDHVIFEQKIWTPYNQTWRPMADRGSITANHFDHVHAAVKA